MKKSAEDNQKKLDDLITMNKEDAYYYTDRLKAKTERTMEKYIDYNTGEPIYLDLSCVVAVQYLPADPNSGIRKRIRIETQQGSIFLINPIVEVVQ